MCGRYATTRSSVDLAAFFDALDETDGALAPKYNVAPTDPVPVVRVSSNRGRVVSVARWGLVPAWAKDPRGAARMINARAETVATANAYAPSFARRRCLIPADGWYEWRKDGTGRQAYFMTPRDGGVLALAGVWARWGSGPDLLTTCSVITTAALGELAEVHDRMPLTLTPDRWAAWLSAPPARYPRATPGPPADPASLLGVPEPTALASLEIRPVGPTVGNVRNDGPQLIERIAVTLSDASREIATDLTLF
jgi:putative SOS response-associated peptidase YedK